MEELTSRPRAHEDTISSSISFREIQPTQTIPLRHSVLWPDAPISHVLLPEDNLGWHYGAFLPKAHGNTSPVAIESPGENGGNAEEEALVAVISFFVESYPVHSFDGETGEAEERGEVPTRMLRFRKFACDVQYQGRGIGSGLLEYASADARAHLVSSIPSSTQLSRGGGLNETDETFRSSTNSENIVLWCDSRTSALGWYEKKGFRSFGEKFCKGTVEYVKIKKEI
ncbi:hypothetical protein ONZ45_g14127 [Pleurotus djamor]|nr:hypothetical protein ONZ45_g14127 [Pleurotus djamor]